MGLTFLNSTFLFAALAALLPLIIHMLSRRQVKTVDFSSLMFLKELERRKVRRVRIRQILLLVVRSLIILCAALALARPTLSGVGAGASSHAKTSVAIVLDTSASMSRRNDGRAIFELARERAREIAGLLGDGDEAFLVSAARPASELLPGGTFSTDVLRRALEDAKPGDAGTDYVGAVERAHALLSESRNLNRELYVVGDMQRSGWDAFALSEAPRIFLLPIEGARGNRSADAVRVERKYGGASGGLTISAEVTNHGAVEVDIPVRLVVDGLHVGQAGVSLAAGATGSASFTTVVDASAWHGGRIELPQDALAADNIRYFVVPPAGRVDVLIVSGGTAAGTAASGGRAAEVEPDAYYVRRALDPTGSRDPYACATIPSAALSRQDHGRFGVVVLADVGRLDAAGEAWLGQHLESGGGVLVILGERTDIRFWNERLGELGAGAIVEPVERRSGLRIAPAGVGHPLLAGLVFGERLIDDASVTRGFRAEPSSETVLELPGVGPLLVLGRPEPGGRSAVLYTGLEDTWSDLPKSGLLVPVLHRMAAELSGAGRVTHDAVVGEDLIVPYEPTRTGVPQVERPDGSTVSAERLPGAAGGAALRSVADVGIYRFPVSGAAGGSAARDAGGPTLAAVNAPADESDLTPATPAEIGAALGGNEPIVVASGTPLADAILVARHGRELWRVFVYAALALVALEMWLARPRF